MVVFPLTTPSIASLTCKNCSKGTKGIDSRIQCTERSFVWLREEME